MHHHMQSLIEKDKLEIKQIPSSLIFINSLTKDFSAGLIMKYYDKQSLIGQKKKKNSQQIKKKLFGDLVKQEKFSLKEKIRIIRNYVI